MSNRDARILQYAPSALALKLRQSTDAPIQPAPKAAISNLSSTAVLPLPRGALTALKTTWQAIGTAQPPYSSSPQCP